MTYVCAIAHRSRMNSALSQRYFVDMLNAFKENRCWDAATCGHGRIGMCNEPGPMRLHTMRLNHGQLAICRPGTVTNLITSEAKAQLGSGLGIQIVGSQTRS